jgi:hypothetical protein
LGTRQISENKDEMNRVFFLSPAHSGGKRAAMLIRPGATFELARQVQIGAARLGDVFAFCSGLYFRGKLTYANRFAGPPNDFSKVLVITSSRGLVAPETFIGIRDLSEFSEIPVHPKEPRFTDPLKRSIEQMAALTSCEVVLLGSVATGKYIDTLLPILGERLLFPSDFAGRGDMSRGALLLRSAAEGKELPYVPILRANRHRPR